MSDSISPASSPQQLNHANALSEFVLASPSSYHAAQTVARDLEASGFTILSESESWSIEPGGKYIVVRDGAVAAWVVPEILENEADSRSIYPYFTIVGAHNDSPGFKLKPNPNFNAEGAEQIGVEIYGGPLLNSWLDRELTLAGRLTLKDGSTSLVQTEPIARIPQLAVHLDRSVNDKLVLDKQKNLQPVIGLATGASPVDGKSGAMELLAESAGVAADDIAGYDVFTYPAQSPAIFGARKEFLASPRLDNLASVYAASTALADVEASQLSGIALMIAFDHEEVGSQTRSGASGPFLADVTKRIIGTLVPDTTNPEELYLRALAASTCISSDAGHAVHPNFADHHDPVNRPVLGGGPLLKINAQQRYSTDSVGTARWVATCAAAGVEYQEFVSNNSIACGTTIGPLTATRLGITTVDIGPALWSMHSAREMCAVNDIAALHDALASSFLTL